MIIIVTGTPASGKSTIAKAIAKELKHKYIDVNKIIKEHKLVEYHDDEKQCDVVDTKKLNKELIKIIKTKKNIVIDSHLSHYLPAKYVDICIVTKCELKTLQERMKKRRYKKAKVRENLDCEIFDICKIEALDNLHNVIEVDTTKRVNMKELIKSIMHISA